MKTEPVLDIGTPPEGQGPRRRRSRLATVGAVLVVLLIAGISALAYAQLAHYHQGQGQGTRPASGTWEKALSGYLVTSLVAAPGDPSVLYACAERDQGNGVVSSASQTILRSADGGLHWQDIGGKAGVITICQLAINPSNSSDVYLVTTAMNSGQQVVRVLKHTTDGGQTWSTIQPVLTLPKASATPASDISQLSIVDQRLFAIQTLPSPVAMPLHKGVRPQYVYQLGRLVTSADGGHTWTVLDQQLATSKQGVDDYAVDPAHINTIYEVVSVPWLPIQPATAGPGATIPFYYGYNAELYKTTDGGATWQLLLNNLLFGSTVQLAANNPQIVYAGGIRRPLPYATTAPGASTPAGAGNFQLHMSKDGGATWSDVPPLPGSTYPQSWFVNGDGQVYVYISGAYVQPGSQITAVAGTAIAVTAVTVPKGTPQSGTPSQPHGMPIASQPALTPPPTVTGITAQIERYDPSTSRWSEVTKPPSQGSLLAVSPNSGNGDVLWFMGSAGNQEVLYREVAV